MDQAHCGFFILRSSSRGAFLWQQFAVNLAARFLNNFSNQDDGAHRELPHPREVNQSLAWYHVRR